MKIVITRTTTVEVDFDHERQKIKELCHEYPIYQKALISVIDAFEKNDFELAQNLYEDLPYHEEDEYPLQESMGRWWWQFRGEDFCWDSNVKTTKTFYLEP